MKRSAIIFAMLTVSSVALGQSQFLRKEVNAKLASWGFSAPSVTGISNLTANANVGDIAIDRATSPGVFYGWNGSSWVNFGGGSGSGNLVVRNVTTTDSSSSSDDVLILSGSSFVETIYTAVGNSGKVLRIIHNGTSLSNVYTLNTTAGQTIGGIASGSYALGTNGETLTIISDGTNWQIQGHSTITQWTNFPSVAAGTLITGSTSNPSYGTVGTNQAQWRRVGSNMEIRWTFRQSSAGASAGSGIYLFNLPSGVAIDTSLAKASTSTTNTIDFIESAVGSMIGADPANSESGMVGVYSTTQLKFKYVFAGTTQGNTVWSSGSVNFAFTSSALSIGMTASVPISGWQP